MGLLKQIAAGWQGVTFWTWRDEAGERFGIASFRSRKKGRSEERIGAIKELERSVALKEVAVAIVIADVIGYFFVFSGSLYAFYLLLVIAAGLFLKGGSLGGKALGKIRDQIERNSAEKNRT